MCLQAFTDSIIPEGHRVVRPVTRAPECSFLLPHWVLLAWLAVPLRQGLPRNVQHHRKQQMLIMTGVLFGGPLPTSRSLVVCSALRASVPTWLVCVTVNHKAPDIKENIWPLLPLYSHHIRTHPSIQTDLWTAV